MEIRKIESIVESILFCAGNPVPVTRIAEAINIDVKTMDKIIDGMIFKYKNEQRGISIIKLDNCCQLISSPDNFEYIKTALETKKPPVLSQSALEVLSIIAYNQPVTKSTIEKIRGVDCSYVINKMCEYELICEKGRLDAPGKPILYGTTSKFLRCFSLKSLSDLPDLSSDELKSE